MGILVFPFLRIFWVFQSQPKKITGSPTIGSNSLPLKKLLITPTISFRGWHSPGMIVIITILFKKNMNVTYISHRHGLLSKKNERQPPQKKQHLSSPHTFSLLAEVYQRKQIRKHTSPNLEVNRSKVPWNLLRINGCCNRPLMYLWRRKRFASKKMGGGTLWREKFAGV